MKHTINRALFEQTAFDSSAPAGTAAVMHRFADPGEYTITFLHEDRPIADARLTVTADAAPNGIAAAPADHVTVDVTALMAQTVIADAPPHRNPFLLRPNGYASFNASGRARPYAVVVTAQGAPYRASGSTSGAGAPAKGIVFDSRRLGAGDLFALTPLRPGRYRLANRFGEYEGSITVAYPVVGDRPYRPPLPVEVECSPHGFKPATIALQPVQGLVFKILGEARLTIELVAPDDGPRDRPAAVKRSRRGDTGDVGK